MQATMVLEFRTDVSMNMSKAVRGIIAEVRGASAA